VIYNFRIGCWEHFSFKILGLGRSNRAKPKCLVLERGRRGRRRPCHAPSAPPLYARTPRQAGVHRSERCAQAPVLDVGGPWSVPRATPARVGRLHRLAPLGVRAAARRSLSLPYRDLLTIGRLRLPPPRAAQALKPYLFPHVQATRCRRPHGCRVSSPSSRARFAARRPPPSNAFHSQLHNPPIASHHLLLSSLSRPDEGNRKIAGRPYQAHWRSASPVTTPSRPPSSPKNGTNRITVSSWCLCFRPLIVLASFPWVFP
jgi:hypothetical protein